MKKLFALCLSALLGVALTLPVEAQQALSAKGTDESCASAEEEASLLPVTAVVSKVDLRQGRALLETSVGQLELAAAPAELRALQTGDVLTLCVDPAALPSPEHTPPALLG
jgi:hypothetical protein